MPSTGTGAVTVTSTVISIGTGIGVGIGKLKTNVESYEELLTLGVNFVCFSVICRQKKGKTNQLRKRQRRVSNTYVNPPLEAMTDLSAVIWSWIILVNQVRLWRRTGKMKFSSTVLLMWFW